MATKYHDGSSETTLASGERRSFSPFRDDTSTLQNSPYSSQSARFVETDDKPLPSFSSEYDSNDEERGATGEEPKPSDLFKDTCRPAGTAPPHIEETGQPEDKSEPVSWRSLPRKDQLFVLILARLSEPLTQNSIGSYIYYQLQSFDPSLPDSTISYQVGIIGAAFPAAQFVTAMLWGWFSDSEYGGRKRTIYLGLLGTMLSTIGFGFSQSFAMAVAFRCLGGIVNGNVGVMRTMISEIIKEKKYQSRAFLILPMVFNVGVIIGPILGGLLADPFATYPSLFGNKSILGGEKGVGWMKQYPYLLPNLTCAIFLFLSSLAVIFFLEETSDLCKHKPDLGLRIGHWICKPFLRQKFTASAGYSAIPDDDLELQPSPSTAKHDKPNTSPRQKLPLRRIWTRNLIITLCAHGLLTMHIGTFNSLWSIHLSTPRFDPHDPQAPDATLPYGLFHFTGGLALPPSSIGLAVAIMGCIGIPLQLFSYPNLSHRLGTPKCFRIFLALFPLAYILAPFLNHIPSWSNPPDGVTGPWIWIAITCVLFIQVLARTFAIPCTAILINNVSPHPSVLGTVHGVGQSVSSLARTVGPVLFSWLFGRGLDMGVVGVAWWCMSGVAVAGWVVAQGVREGDGHEILLEGEGDGERRGM